MTREGAGHILRPYEQDNTDYTDDTMPVCPICGSKPFVSRDIVEGMYFGWSVGCPRFCIDDGIHGYTLESPKEDSLACHWLDSKEDCVKWWEERVCREGERQ